MSLRSGTPPSSEAKMSFFTIRGTELTQEKVSRKILLEGVRFLPESGKALFDSGSAFSFRYCFSSIYVEILAVCLLSTTSVIFPSAETEILLTL